MRRLLAALALVLAATAALPGSRTAAFDDQAADAASPLLAYADPAEAGFSKARLEEARAFADTNRAAAVVALHRGRVIAAWGAVDRNLMAHSVRKSLAGALYGIAVDEGRLSLDATLADLEIDDLPPLTATERAARVRDLVAARSGVYHPAAYADGSQEAARPARGSHAPGSHWFYNNWDFNALESIYTRATGEDLYQAFARRIAAPIGMQDFRAEGQLRVLEPGQSRFPAHTFRISARDLARFGQLYLQDGVWNGRQVVPGAWIRESLRTHSDTGNGTGYGYLWWTYEPGSLGANYPVLDKLRVVLARGTGGQTIFLIPGAEMVVVHRADTDNGRSVAGPLIWQLVERLVSAREGRPSADPALRPMVATPFASQLPAAPTPAFVPLAADALTRLAGEYEMAPGRVVRVFLHDGRLFAHLPGQGEAELFALSPLSFAVQVQAGVSVIFLETEGRIEGVRITIGRQAIEARRR